MRVLILADKSFATRERSLLTRLEVGLVDEGVRVVHAVPRSVAPELTPPTGELFTQRVAYEDRGPRLFRRARARQLVAELTGTHDTASEPPVDLVHVFGDDAWPLATEVAALLGVGLAVEVWRADLVAPAVRLRPGGPGGGGQDRASSPVVLFAVDRPMERLLRDEADRTGGAAVRPCALGVHTPARPHDLLTPGRVPSILIVGGGHDAAGLAAALRGIVAMPAGVEPLVFADADMCRRTGAWGVVRRLGLTSRFTLVPEVEARREITLRSDLVLMPEAIGEHRSFTLDAMAAGAVVVAAADPMVSHLIEGRTARLVERPLAERWTAVVGSVLADPLAARTLAASAREYTRASCRATAHVAAVIDAYEWMTTGDALPFRGAARS
jgi:hypothetical protein